MVDNNYTWWYGCTRAMKADRQNGDGSKVFLLDSLGWESLGWESPGFCAEVGAYTYIVMVCAKALVTTSCSVSACRTGWLQEFIVVFSGSLNSNQNIGLLHIQPDSAHGFVDCDRTSERTKATVGSSNPLSS